MSAKGVFLTVLSAALASSAQDVMNVGSADYKVEIDNQWVRVLRVNHPAGAKVAMHEHPASVAVFLTDVHERITGADGKARDVNVEVGEVAFNEAAKHAEENIGTKPLEAVIIELKPGAPRSPPISLDPVKTDPKHHPVLLENDRVRVIKTILEPHLKAPEHEHPHYVVVYLTDLHTTMKLADGRVLDNPRKPGDIAWRDALKHQAVQEGANTAVEIQVEIK